MFVAGPQARLAAIRALMSSAAALDAALEAGRRGGATAPGTGPTTPRRRGARAAAGTPAPDAEQSLRAGEAEDSSTTGRAAVSASDRRAAATTLIAIWASVARDVAIAGLGAGSQLGDPELIEEFREAAQGLPAEALPNFLARLAEAAAQLDENVNPELALDVLALAWPRPKVVGDTGAAKRRPAASVPPAATSSNR
jgi:hypothetical protein